MSTSIPEDDLNERLSFLQLDAAGIERIRRIKSIIDRELPAALDKFYSQVRATPQVARLFAQVLASGDPLLAGHPG